MKKRIEAAKKAAAGSLSFRKACVLLGVNRSTVYKLQEAMDSPCKRQIKNAQLIELIKEIQVANRHTYGVDRMTAELNKLVCKINHKRVARLMRENGLNAIFRKKRNYFCAVEKIRREKLLGNILNRDFSATRPGEKLVSDVTYMPLKEGSWCYVSLVKDLCTSMVVACAMSRSQNMDLAFETLRLVKDFTHKGLFHTDQGYLYTNAAFAQEFKKMGLTQSLFPSC